MEIINRCDSSSWGIKTGILTLSDNRYVCPFCSHGGTIELHCRAEKSKYMHGFEYEYFLSCLGSCMSYQLMKIQSQHYSDDNQVKALEKAKIVFEKLIIFSDNFKDYKKDINYIL